MDALPLNKARNASPGVLAPSSQRVGLPWGVGTVWTYRAHERRELANRE